MSIQISNHRRKASKSKIPISPGLMTSTRPNFSFDDSSPESAKNMSSITTPTAFYPGGSKLSLSDETTLKSSMQNGGPRNEATIVKPLNHRSKQSATSSTSSSMSSRRPTIMKLSLNKRRHSPNPNHSRIEKRATNHACATSSTNTPTSSSTKRKLSRSPGTSPRVLELASTRARAPSRSRSPNSSTPRKESTPRARKSSRSRTSKSSRKKSSPTSKLLDSFSRKQRSSLDEDDTEESSKRRTLRKLSRGKNQGGASGQNMEKKTVLPLYSAAAAAAAAAALSPSSSHSNSTSSLSSSAPIKDSLVSLSHTLSSFNPEDDDRVDVTKLQQKKEKKKKRANDESKVVVVAEDDGEENSREKLIRDGRRKTIVFRRRASGHEEDDISRAKIIRDENRKTIELRRHSSDHGGGDSGGNSIRDENRQTIQFRRGRAWDHDDEHSVDSGSELGQGSLQKSEDSVKVGFTRAPTVVLGDRNNALKKQRQTILLNRKLTTSHEDKMARMTLFSDFPTEGEESKGDNAASNSDYELNAAYDELSAAADNFAEVSKKRARARLTAKWASSEKFMGKPTTTTKTTTSNNNNRNNINSSTSSGGTAVVDQDAGARIQKRGNISDEENYNLRVWIRRLKENMSEMEEQNKTRMREVRTQHKAELKILQRKLDVALKNASSPGQTLSPPQKTVKELQQANREEIKDINSKVDILENVLERLSAHRSSSNLLVLLPNGGENSDPHAQATTADLQSLQRQEQDIKMTLKRENTLMEKQIEGLQKKVADLEEKNRQSDIESNLSRKWAHAVERELIQEREEAAAYVSRLLRIVGRVTGGGGMDKMETLRREASREMKLLKPVFGFSLSEDKDGASKKVVIGNIESEGPAQRAGLKLGDTLATLNGHVVKEKRSCLMFLNALRPQDKVHIGLERDGKANLVSLEVGGKSLGARPMETARLRQIVKASGGIIPIEEIEAACETSTSEIIKTSDDLPSSSSSSKLSDINAMGMQDKKPAEKHQERRSRGGSVTELPRSSSSLSPSPSSTRRGLSVGNVSSSSRDNGKKKKKKKKKQEREATTATTTTTSTTTVVPNWKRIGTWSHPLEESERSQYLLPPPAADKDQEQHSSFSSSSSSTGKTIARSRSLNRSKPPASAAAVGAELRTSSKKSRTSSSNSRKSQKSKRLSSESSVRRRYSYSTVFKRSSSSKPKVGHRDSYLSIGGGGGGRQKKKQQPVKTKIDKWMDDWIKKSPPLQVSFSPTGENGSRYEAKYKFGTKTIHLVMFCGTVRVRVGGGTLSLEEFIAQNEENEESKMRNSRPPTPVLRK